MVDIKAYIDSGVLDSYVLGLVDNQEKQEVECLSKIYPEIGAELETAQKAIEGFVKSMGENPPAHIKQQVLERIKNMPQLPATKQISEGIPTTPKVKKLPLFNRWAAAASIALLISAGMLAVWNLKLKRGIDDLHIAQQIEVNELTNTLNQSQLQLATIQNILSNDATQTVLLNGTTLSPEAKANVYWNDQQDKAVFVNNSLPKALDKKQYQLWAIVDGKPVNLGVLEDSESHMAIRDVSGIKNIEAFAVTLEPYGGSPVPHLDQLYVIGTTKG